MPPPLSLPSATGADIHFNEALLAAQARGVVLPDIYYGQLQGVARQLAFSIAGVAVQAQLKAVLDDLNKAQGTGQTFEQWRKNVSVTELGLSKWRQETIYRTNLQGQYQAGRWEQIERNKKNRPYLMYDALNDARTRPTHLAMDNIIRPVDDVFWSLHSPPNGYNCRCGVISLTEAQAQARSKGDGKGLNKPIDDEKMQPDKGWGYSPRDRLKGVGQAVAKVEAVGGALPDALGTYLKRTPKVMRLDDYIASGHLIADELLQAVGSDPLAFRAELLRRLQAQVGTATPANVTVFGNRDMAAKTVEHASTLLPDSWVKATDNFGKLHVRQLSGRDGDDRAFQKTITGNHTGRKLDLTGDLFGVVDGGVNVGYIATGTSISTALHEYAHRVQSALPSLDELFQSLHRRRTAKDATKRLADIYPGRGYGASEMAKEDHYIDAYFGKEYRAARPALEVMTMAIENVLAGKMPLANYNEHPITALLGHDREMLDLTIGALFNYVP